ncbi:hypothetical protein KSP40_PGU020520 [Platanthera guangdongensis]|uniref:Uncharacterized protein n=1 Tax=Platanthera guangdongensis TaxID=2320717 RepID=A0ABR2LZX0_9ASPA
MRCSRAKCSAGVEPRARRGGLPCLGAGVGVRGTPLFLRSTSISVWCSSICRMRPSNAVMSVHDHFRERRVDERVGGNWIDVPPGTVSCADSSSFYLLLVTNSGVMVVAWKLPCQGGRAAVARRRRLGGGVRLSDRACGAVGPNGATHRVSRGKAAPRAVAQGQVGLHTWLCAAKRGHTWVCAAELHAARRSHPKFEIQVQKQNGASVHGCNEHEPLSTNNNSHTLNVYAERNGGLASTSKAASVHQKASQSDEVSPNGQVSPAISRDNINIGSHMDELHLTKEVLTLQAAHVDETTHTLLNPSNLLVGVKGEFGVTNVIKGERSATPSAVPGVTPLPSRPSGATPINFSSIFPSGKPLHHHLHLPLRLRHLFSFSLLFIFPIFGDLTHPRIEIKTILGENGSEELKELLEQDGKLQQLEVAKARKEEV